jgi:simple sugar transport system substrate-binding protein
MRELLEKYGRDGFDVVYSHNDSMTLGVLDVLENTKDAPKDLILITVDGEKEAVDALKAGRINCVVQCTPDLGPSVMKLVGDLKDGKKLPKVYHPDEGSFTDFDDLTDSRVEGF